MKPLFKRACALNNPDALYFMGELYIAGRHYDKNPTIALDV
jgi:TPR repeat protein